MATPNSQAFRSIRISCTAGCLGLMSTGGFAMESSVRLVYRISLSFQSSTLSRRELLTISQKPKGCHEPVVFPILRPLLAKLAPRASFVGSFTMPPGVCAELSSFTTRYPRPCVVSYAGNACELLPTTRLSMDHSRPLFRRLPASASEQEPDL